MYDKGFGKCDVVLTFSRIAINKEEDKSMIVMIANFGKLNGFSTICFLLKEKGKWRVSCEEGLSVS